MPCQCTYVFSPRYLGYDLGPEHPLRPQRLQALNDLIEGLGWLEGAHVGRVEPAAATDAELQLAHSEGYIEAVRALSAAEPGVSAAIWGLGPGDTPAFPGMHEFAAAIAGGTLTAARMVMQGETAHAFNPGGGLHHAMRDRASGFCIYNDLAVAIAAVVVEYGARVLYVDLDVHHGDGVQAAFYDDPRVLTVSFHETGRYLFPGTGAVPELGTGAGLGYSINVPLQAYTEDGSWLEAVESVLPPLVAGFQPDLILSQHGCDGHVWDGQSHLLLTNRASIESARLVHELAHEYANGRWVATGGGGYDPVRVVPRAWAAVWGAVSGQQPPPALPAAWVARWQPAAAGPLPDTLDDPPGIVPEIPRRAVIEQENRATVDRVRSLALSPRLRQTYRPSGSWTPGVIGQLPTGRVERLELGGRPLIVRERVPLSMVRRLRVAPDMHAFTKDAQREARLLRRLAERSDTNLTVAHTPEGEIVAEVSMAPADGRWADVDGVYEIAIEVARGWRGVGLGEAMLKFVLSADFAEDLVLIALGLSWHWDLEAMKLTPEAYRTILLKTFEPSGFRVYTTDDPEINAGPGNVLLARVGSRVPSELYDEFYRRLDRRADWFGF